MVARPVLLMVAYQMGCCCCQAFCQVLHSRLWHWLQPAVLPLWMCFEGRLQSCQHLTKGIVVLLLEL